MNHKCEVLSNQQLQCENTGATQNIPRVVGHGGVVQGASMSASALVWNRVIMMVLLLLVWGVGKWPCEMASSGFYF
jgi:hypothetical protein